MAECKLTEYSKFHFWYFDEKSNHIYDLEVGQKQIVYELFHLLVNQFNKG